MPLFIETPLNSRAAKLGPSGTASCRRVLGQKRSRQAAARDRTRSPGGFAITAAALRLRCRRQVSSVSWSSVPRAADVLAESVGPALCARPSCESGAAAAAGGSRRVAWSRLAAGVLRPSASLGNLASRQKSPPRHAARNSWFMVAGAMSAEGQSPRPNTSLKRGRATAWRQGREAALVYRRPRGPGAKPLRAA